MDLLSIEPLWWHWALLGFGLMLSELFITAFFMLWFGLGCFLVVLVLLLVPDMPLYGQVLLWTISSIVMTVLWFRVFKRSYHKSLIGRASAQIEGETGIMAQSVAPFKKGKVRFQKPIVGSDLWPCTAQEEITEGARVRVVSVEGNSVVVEKLKG